MPTRPGRRLARAQVLVALALLVSLPMSAPVPSETEGAPEAPTEAVARQLAIARDVPPETEDDPGVVALPGDGVLRSAGPSPADSVSESAEPAGEVAAAPGPSAAPVQPPSPGGGGVPPAASATPVPPTIGIDVRSFGATGDGSTDDTEAIRRAIASAPPGATVSVPSSPAFYRISDTLTIDKPLTLLGPGELRQSAAGTRALLINASDVTVRHLRLRGPQFASFRDTETAIRANGATNLVLDGLQISSWGDTGIYLNQVAGFAITGCVISDAVYAGIITTSATDGRIEGCSIARIGVHGSGAHGNNAYGVILSAASGQSPSARITVRGNTVTDVPTWTALDTHGGHQIAFVGNIVRRAYRGIFVQGADARDAVVEGNDVEAGTLADRAWAITVHGTATAQVRNNTSRGYGIYVLESSSVTIAGNSVIGPDRNIGVQVGERLASFEISGNSLQGTGSGIGIHVIGPGATGAIGSNTVSGFGAAFEVEPGNSVTVP